jgi:2-hydroxychromene-2-carboxylate isomerase
VEGRGAPRQGLRYPLRRHPDYPVDPESLANRVGVLAATEGWCPEYTKATYSAWFLEDRPPGEPEHLYSILASLGKDPETVVSRADSEEIRARYAAETDVARKLGIFGSPTFVVGGEIFWGDDRLEDALAWRTSHPD